MGKTSESLRQVLEGYSIRHSQLAQAIGFPESMLSQWLQGHLDLPADTIPTIVETLRSLNGHAVLPKDKWQKQVENFISNFKLSSSEDLLDLHKLCNLYERELIPQVALAVNNGFSPDWRYAA